MWSVGSLSAKHAFLLKEVQGVGIFFFSAGASVGSPPATILFTHLTKWDALPIRSATIVFF